MRRKIGFLIVLAYVAVIAAAILMLGCSDDAPSAAAGNTPNLLAEGLVFSAERVPAGGGIEMTRTLRNDGTTDASEFVVEYYLSTDAELDDDGDALVATETVAGLAAGDEDTRPVALACGTLAGDFRCIARIDPADAVHEIDEEDNLAVSAATLKVCTPPNLKAEGTALLTASPAARPGSALETTAAVLETEGGLDVELAFDVTAYLSPDDAIDPESDLPLLVQSAGPLAAGGSELVPLLLALPEITPPGRWYVGSRVDSSDLVAETDETDNLDAAGTLAVVDVLEPALAPGEVDLVAYDSRAALPWNGSAYELVSGSRFLCLVDVLSMGEPAAGEFRIGIYFSDDDALTASDTLVGSATVTAAEAARGSVPIECLAPEAPAGSTFRWGAIVDDLGAVAEADETNNAHVNWSLEIVSTPEVDLVAAFVNDGPPMMAMEVGQPRLVNFSLACAGSTESGYFTVKLYASPDAEITGDPGGNDVEIGYKWFRYLPAGYSSAGMGRPEWATVTLPAGTAPGYYRIGYIVDVYNQVVETNEANNTRNYPAPVAAIASGAPDLVVVMHDVTRPETGGASTWHAAAGTALAAWPVVSVGNYGTRAAAAATVGIYAAATQTPDPSSDTLVGTLDAGALEAGEFRKLRDVALDLSALGEGTHYLYACIDPAGAVAEADETNNTSDHLQIGAFTFGGWVALEVGPPAPNLVARARPDSGVVVDRSEGTRLWLTWEVSNRSLSDAARPSAVSLWLSRDAEPTVSPGDVYLLSDTVGQLPPGARFGKHLGVELPFAPEVGIAYRVKVMADSAREVAEADETDNVGASSAFSFVAQP